MFKKLSPPFLIFLIVFLLFLTNYSPDTWLTGWDNLHPEFNFNLNIKRSIFAIWQEYQGLGLLGGMGHASDLSRQIFLWIASLILPINFLRYFYHFLMLFLGPLGVYFLLKKIILRRFGKEQIETASLIGAIFYLFNLATLQMFYVPFEPYSTHFAFLPWLFLVNLNFLNNQDKKSFILLLLVNLFAIPQGYVGTYFLVYFFALSLVFLFYLLQKRTVIKRILIAYLLLFCINAFWLLPNLYFVATNTRVNVSAKINQMSTENNLLKNKKYGNLANTVILKGFWFDNAEPDKEGKISYQMGRWISHLENPLILGVGYLLFLLSITGVLLAFKKKIKRGLVFFPVFIFAFTLLSSDTPIFSFVTNLFYKVPLFFQVFRFPYTKLAIITAFCLSIFYSITYLLFSAVGKNSLLKKVIFFVFAFLPIIFLYPVFQGQLFYNKNKAKIPQEYFQLFDFLKMQGKNSRIANFPQNTYWGWEFYRWNYSGSGFLWYGIEQPILDRAFDPWSDKNENYYWEISYALYSQNQELFEKVLEKYQINWLLVDENVINPSSPKALYFDELEEMIKNSKKIALAQTFGEIKIYQVNLEAPVKDFVFLAKNLPIVGPKYNWNNFDIAYYENGNYVGNPQSSILNPQFYYPFRSLFSGKTQEDLEFEVEDKGDFFIFRKTLPEAFKGYRLKIPKLIKEELMWVDPNDLSQVRYLKPEVVFDENKIEVKVPKVGGYFSATIEPTSDRSFWLPNLPHRYAYLIAIESRHIAGKSLLFWLENSNSRKPDIETYLPKNPRLTTSYFIQPPMEKDGLGYTLHFDNVSIGKEKSVNDLGKITVNLIPYNFLVGLKFSSQSKENNQKLTAPLKVTHSNPSFYQIEGDFTSNQVLVLSQAFHPGWQAFTIKSSSIKQIKTHVLVNNWANGWLLEDDEKGTIMLIFLPQFLEYFGFLLLLVLGCSLVYFLLK